AAAAPRARRRGPLAAAAVCPSGHRKLSSPDGAAIYGLRPAYSESGTVRRCGGSLPPHYQPRPLEPAETPLARAVHDGPPGFFPDTSREPARQAGPPRATRVAR